MDVRRGDRQGLAVGLAVDADGVDGDEELVAVLGLVLVLLVGPAHGALDDPVAVLLDEALLGLGDGRRLLLLGGLLDLRGLGGLGLLVGALLRGAGVLLLAHGVVPPC